MFLSLSPVLRGALFSLLGFVVWSCSDVLTKIAGLEGVSIFIIVGLSGWGALAVILFGTFLRGKEGLLRPNRIKPHVIRTLLFIPVSFVNVVAFTNLPLTTVYIGLFCGPFLISLFGAFFMNEPLGRAQILAIALGFAGVLTALLPEAQSAAEGSGDPFLGFLILPIYILLYAANMLFLRVLGRTETVESMSFIPFFARSVLFLPFFWIDEIWLVPEATIFAVLGMGVLTGLGFLLMSTAYKLAPVAIVSPFHYTQLLTGAFFGYFIWGVVPSGWLFAGGALIVASGLMIARQAHQQGKRAQPPA